MVVVIRVDSSFEIGSGHVMRCLTLAEQLKKMSAEVFFICSELPGNIIDLIEKKGYTVDTIPCKKAVQQGDIWKNDLECTRKIIVSIKKQVDWLIVDHYGLDVKWETELQSYVRKIMVIDDLANRKHNCDLLLDQNLYLDMEKRYQNLVPSQCKQLLGPSYLLLRSEFYEARGNLRERSGKVSRIILFFGGSDSTNETEKTLEAVRLLKLTNIATDVVVGIANLNKERIKQLCSDMENTTFYCQINHMAQLLADADFAVGAGGTATWERCFLGVPSITIAVAGNQIETTEAVAGLGATLYIGESSTVNAQHISRFIMKMLNDPTALSKMSKESMDLVGTPFEDKVGKVLVDMREI